jgi:YXWGXW repeat-containing protein
MKTGFYLIALTPLLFAGCESEPVVTTTTTETRQETVRTQGDRVVAREVVVTRTPPAVRVETQTTSPGAQYIWTRGYWRWNGADYVWVPGSWIMRPRPGAVWVEGQWARRGGGWVWIAGHWQS